VVESNKFFLSVFSRLDTLLIPGQGEEVGEPLPLGIHHLTGRYSQQQERLHRAQQSEV
jgi:hypothetical protein